jgi:excisionase family DNA binding protein
METSQVAVARPIIKLAYSADEAAAVTSLSKTKIWEAIAAGRLIARKDGGRTIILATDLGAYLEALPTTKEAA